jgi:FkbM family methyltransferase
MANVAKKIFVKSREKLLSNLTSAVQESDHKITALSNEHDALVTQVAELKDLINASSNQLHDQIKNAGAIMVSPQELLVKIFSGLKIYLDPRDISVTPHLALDSIWEYHITRAWLSVVNRHDTVLDIGANFGYFGALAAQVTDKKNSKVVFFEANPQLIPYINKTLSVNWLNEQSEVVNKAVADKPGKVKLNVLKDYIGSSSLLSTKQIDSYMHEKMHVVETETSISVEAITVDGYCKQAGLKQVNLIKMDIEGYEDKAYEGMRKTIKASPNVTLFVEFTKESYADPKSFYETMLADFGHVYLIDASGQLTLQEKTDYVSVIGSPEDWIMPVFSKNDKLAVS